MINKAVLVDLNLFMNFSTNRVEQLPILETVRSFSEAFDLAAFAKIRVFCHAAPLKVPFDQLYSAMRNAIPDRAIELHSTRGLADGYVRSIHLSDAEVLYQLEHDYLFEPRNIEHTLPEICRAMRDAQVPYLRFNVGQNVDNELDRITAFDMAGVPCCKTVIFSNRPHLIDRSFAQKNYVPVIDLSKGGSRGIEDQLTKQFNVGWIYGPVGHPPVIKHTDGRRLTKQWRGQNLLTRAVEFTLRNAKLLRDRFSLGNYGRIF